MKTIHKYLINYHGYTEVPDSGKVVLVGMQRHQVYLWMEVNPDVNKEVLSKAVFKIVPTGGDIFNEYKHIGSVVDVHDGHDLVWHVYRIR